MAILKSVKKTDVCHSGRIFKSECGYRELNPDFELGKLTS